MIPLMLKDFKRLYTESFRKQQKERAGSNGNFPGLFRFKDTLAISNKYCLNFRQNTPLGIILKRTSLDVYREDSVPWVELPLVQQPSSRGPVS